MEKMTTKELAEYALKEYEKNPNFLKEISIEELWSVDFSLGYMQFKTNDPHEL